MKIKSDIIIDDPNDILLDLEFDDDLLFDDLIDECQCGGDKCNTTHSTWCPKYL